MRNASLLVSVFLQAYIVLSFRIKVKWEKLKFLEVEIIEITAWVAISAIQMHAENVYWLNSCVLKIIRAQSV